MRYDTYDDRWDVSSKPHHLHTRGENVAIKSPMIGLLEKDIPYLIQVLKNLLE